jgi:hypothetical protein
MEHIRSAEEGVLQMVECCSCSFNVLFGAHQLHHCGTNRTKREKFFSLRLETNLKSWPEHFISISHSAAQNTKKKAPYNLSTMAFFHRMHPHLFLG